MRKFTAIDLFAGAGGLSEGFMQTKRFDFLAHVEWETAMVETLRKNLITRWDYSEIKAIETVIKFDIQKTEELIHGSWSEDTRKLYGHDNSHKISKSGLGGILGGRKVDVIIGGPPCQAYSIAGRAQDPNSMKNDYRNYLFESFVKIVSHFRPKVFVFENVPGILSAVPGDIPVIERIFEAFNSIGYEIRTPELLKKSIYLSSDYGVPQNRNRVIIFGVDKECGWSLEEFYFHLDILKSKSKKTVRDTIGDLPKFQPLEKSVKIGNRNVSHTLVNNEEVIPYHEARFHNERDISVFKLWLSSSMNYLSNDKKLEFYKRVTGRSTNHNKYRSLEWDKPSPTIVSHLYKDGLMFIHPDIDQLRSITVKEAALLQTFPDDYEFAGSSASCFKMIGNAVPVDFSKKIAEAIINTLEE